MVNKESDVKKENNVTYTIITVVSLVLLIFGVSKSLGEDNDLNLEEEKKETVTIVKEENINKEVVLYESFILSNQKDKNAILRNSRLIQTRGKIKEGKLKFTASTTEKGIDEKQIHSIYFYIDTGKTGGHLGAFKKNSKVQKGEGTFNVLTSPYNNSFDLNDVKISVTPSGQKSINLIDRLNDNRTHYVGAFESTGIYGQLDDLHFEYTCAEDNIETETNENNCEISILK